MVPFSGSLVSEVRKIEQISSDAPFNGCCRVIGFLTFLRGIFQPWPY